MSRVGHRKLLLLPALVLLAMTVPHLEQGDFRRDTARYAAVGTYMWTDGSLLRPHLNPQTPYFSKPPLALWIHGLALRIFGMHLPVARAPSILAALGALSLSVLTARRLGSNSEALASGLVLALTIEFTRRTREISLDFWQLFFLMAAAWGVVSAAKLNRQWLVMVAGVPIGLALLCKPLVGLGTIPIFAIWLLLLGRGSWWTWLIIGTLPVALLVALPWHLYMWHEFGRNFTNQYLVEEVVNRAKGMLAPNPPQYYVIILAKSYWPWALAVGYALYTRFGRAASARRPNRDLVLLGGTWTLYTLILLSCFKGKQVNFALPLYPMLSWVAAAGLCRLPWPALRLWYARGLPWLAPAAIVLLLALSLAPIRFQKPPDKDWLALFRWMDQQGLTGSRLAAQHLDYDDICYFYVKRGDWLPRIDPAAVGSIGSVNREYLLRKVPAQPGGAEPPEVFRSGELVVTRVSVP